MHVIHVIYYERLCRVPRLTTNNGELRTEVVIAKPNCVLLNDSNFDIKSCSVLPVSRPAFTIITEVVAKYGSS